MFDHSSISLRSSDARAWALTVYNRDGSSLLSAKQALPPNKAMVQMGQTSIQGGIGGFHLKAVDNHGRELFTLDYGELRRNGKATGYDHLVLNEHPVAVIALYTTIQGRLFVGGIEQKRDNNPAVTFEFVRGGIEAGEAPEEGAVRELFEETGLSNQLNALPGEPFNAEPAWIAIPNGGQSCFAAEVSAEQLTEEGSVYTLKTSTENVDPFEVGMISEKILFKPVSEALLTSDGPTLACLARLLQFLGKINY